jgi:hypothetical protein
MFATVALLAAWSTQAFAGGASYSPTLIPGGSAPGKLQTLAKAKVDWLKDRRAANKAWKAYLGKNRDVKTFHRGAKGEAHLGPIVAAEALFGAAVVTVPLASKPLELMMVSNFEDSRQKAVRTANTRTVVEAASKGKAPPTTLLEQMERTGLLESGTTSRITEATSGQ